MFENQPSGWFFISALISLQLIFLIFFSDPLRSELRNMNYKVVQKKYCTTL